MNFLGSSIHSPTKTRGVNQRLLHFPHTDPWKLRARNPPARHPVDVLCPRKNPTSMLALRATRLRPHNPHQSHKKVEQYPSALQGGAFFLPRAKETFSFTPLGSPSDPPCSKPKRSGGFLRITQKKKIQCNEGCRLNPTNWDNWSHGGLTQPPSDWLVYSNSADWNFYYY